ncbi:MAG TPA: DUF3127 domain-containing protein [Bacteroidales bacterium]|nr:DUF3127 domain-containing protein [Bacteroidales bacterium]
MEISGKVYQILPEQQGEGRGGGWRRLDFILEAPGQYPRKICIGLWGDKIDQANLQVGEQVTASIDIESREYNGKWFTSVKAWKIEKNKDNTARQGDELPPPGEPPTTSFSEDADLPF